MGTTIDKAIKILTRGSPESDKATFTEYAEARDLGIEALKVIKNGRPFGYVALDEPLPGEKEK